MSNKVINKNGKAINIKISDTSGQERYKTISRSYYNGANGFFIVYDITNKESYNNLDKWVKEIKLINRDNPRKIILGNKSDLSDQRQVFSEDISKITQKYKIDYLEVSALNGDKIDIKY